MFALLASKRPEPARTASRQDMRGFDAQEVRSPTSFVREAELDSERLSAIVRLVIFTTLMALVLMTEVDHHHERLALLTVGFYGVGALLALALAWRRWFHPALPYVYVTFDVILVALSVLLLARLLNIQPHMAFAVPASALIFVVLAHAAMRFRPGLVVYAGTLMIVLIASGTAILPTDGAGEGFIAGGRHGDLLDSVVHSRILPFVIIALTTLALWATSRRTLTMVEASIDHSRRVATLSRFFSPRIADRLAREEMQGQPFGSRHRCAVMFIDMRDFTRLSKQRDPSTVARFLTEFRSRLTRVIFDHGGTVDKFIGDAVLAVFGMVEPGPDDPARAVVCGLGILSDLEDWNEARGAAAEPPIGIGIGAHYGEVFAGAVGDATMLEFTVLGDTVNLAERLERLTRCVDSAFVVSRELLAAAGRVGEDIAWKPIPSRLLIGRLEGTEALALETRRSASVG